MPHALPHQSGEQPSAHDGATGSAAPARRPAVGPPSKHELAVMIWIAVFPTLTVLNLALGPWLAGLNPVVRTFALATIAVPVVIYGLMPRLHALRARVLIRREACAATDQRLVADVPGCPSADHRGR